jgi:ankyrin repeat protein
MLRIPGALIISALFLFLATSCKTLEVHRQTGEPFISLYQNQQEIPLYQSDSLVEVKAEAFALRFYNKRYNAEADKMYAMQVAAFIDASQMPAIRTGMSVDSVPCFWMGTGLACSNNGRYDALQLNPRGHHYLYYGDEQNNRVRCLSTEGDLHQLEFNIDSINYYGATKALKDTKIDELFLLLFTDKNLNRKIEAEEWSRITIRIKDNYKGWHQPYWNRQDSLGQTALHRLFLFKQWDECSESQKQAIVKEACSLPDVNLNLQDTKGNTALHYAIGTYRGYHQGKWVRSLRHSNQVIQTLLSQASCNVNATNYYYNNTALQHYLMRSETGVNRISEEGLDVIRLFLKRDDLVLSHENNVWFTAYNYACQKNWLDAENNQLVEQLKPQSAYNANASSELWKMIRQVDFNASVADSAFFVENIQLCIDYAANLNARKDQWLPLTYLCDTQGRPYGYSEQDIDSNMSLRAILLKQLMSASACDVNAHDGEGLTALHRAVEGKSPSLVRAIVQHDKTDLNVQNTEGNTPLMDMLQNLHYRLRDEQPVLECLQALTSTTERLNWQVINHKGQSLCDLLDELLNEAEEHTYYPSKYPEVYQLLKELREKLQSNKSR